MIQFIQRNSGVVALVILAIMGVSGFVGLGGPQLFGATSCANITCLAGGLRLVADIGGTFESDVAAIFSGGTKVGTSGTNTSAIVYGNCTIWAPANTIAATSTQQIVCQGGTAGITAIPGITTDALCHLTMASSTNTTIASLAIGGASASSTAGTIVARLINLTGDTFTWTAAASSSSQWKYDCYDPA